MYGYSETKYTKLEIALSKQLGSKVKIIYEDGSAIEGEVFISDKDFDYSWEFDLSFLFKYYIVSCKDGINHVEDLFGRGVVKILTIEGQLIWDLEDSKDE